MCMIREVLSRVGEVNGIYRYSIFVLCLDEWCEVSFWSWWWSGGVGDVRGTAGGVGVMCSVLYGLGGYAVFRLRGLAGFESISLYLTLKCLLRGGRVCRGHVSGVICCKIVTG